MTSPDLNSFVAVPLPLDLYQDLLQRFGNGANTVLESITRDFLERTANDPFAQAEKKRSLHWETLELPHGTEIRTKYFGDWKQAQIEDGAIVWDGQTYPSMSQLASDMRGNTSNNAWKVLELRRPNDKQWTPADVLRHIR